MLGYVESWLKFILSQWRCNPEDSSGVGFDRNGPQRMQKYKMAWSAVVKICFGCKQ